MNVIHLQEHLDDEQMLRIELLFEHNLDIYQEENDETNYLKVLTIFNKVVNFESLDIDDLSIIIDFSQQEHYIFVENFVDEDFNDFYKDSVKSSFLLLRTLLVLKDKMKG